MKAELKIKLYQQQLLSNQELNIVDNIHYMSGAALINIYMHVPHLTCGHLDII
jgi:hypothetical protein